MKRWFLRQSAGFSPACPQPVCNWIINITKKWDGHDCFSLDFTHAIVSSNKHQLLCCDFLWRREKLSINSIVREKEMLYRWRGFCRQFLMVMFYKQNTMYSRFLPSDWLGEDMVWRVFFRWVVFTKVQPALVPPLLLSSSFTQCVWLSRYADPTLLATESTQQGQKAEFLVLLPLREISSLLAFFHHFHHGK